jgi:hypothetical protein
MNTGPRDDAEDRAIARALGVSEEDAAEMDDTRVREYQREYEEVLAHLPFDEKAPPPALEAKVLAAARAKRAPAATSIAPTSIDRARRRRRGAARFAAMGAAIAAAASIVVFAVTSDGDGDGTSGRIDQVSSTDEVAVALEQPGTRTAALDGVGSVALTAGGDGYLYDLALPGEPTTLWLQTASDAIRVGDIDSASAVVKFHVSGAVDSVRGVFVTAGDTEIARAEL